MTYLKIIAPDGTVQSFEASITMGYAQACKEVMKEMEKSILLVEKFHLSCNDKLFYATNLHTGAEDALLQGGELQVLSGFDKGDDKLICLYLNGVYKIEPMYITRTFVCDLRRCPPTKEQIDFAVRDFIVNTDLHVACRKTSEVAFKQGVDFALKHYGV